MMTRRKRHVRAYAKRFLIDTGLILAASLPSPAAKRRKDLSGYSPMERALAEQTVGPGSGVQQKTGPRH